MEQLDLFVNPIQEKGDLKSEFGANSFSILDTKDGLWQARKKKWINMGIESELECDAFIDDARFVIDELKPYIRWGISYINTSRLYDFIRSKMDKLGQRL